MDFIVLETEKVAGIAENEHFLSLKPLINRKTKKGGNKQNLPINYQHTMEITVVFTEQLYVKNVLLQKQIVARIIPNVVSESSGGCLYTHVEKYVNNNTVNISLSQKKKNPHAEAVCKTLNTPLPLP